MSKRISIIALALSALAFAGCNNAEYKVTPNSIYLTDADGQVKSKIISLDGGADITLTARLAQKTDEDVTVPVLFQQSDLDEFNSLNGTEYQMLPDGMLPSELTLTIPAGEISASETLHINDFEGEGSYAVPVRLGNAVSGNVPTSTGQGKFLYALAKPLIVSVPVMKGAGQEGVSGIFAAPSDPWGLELDAWTFEAWIKMNGYDSNNQAFFESGAATPNNIFMRFGDANSPYNYLQVKVLNGQIDTDRDLEPNVWCHWAMVYDGTTFTIYRNGQVDKSSTPQRPTTPSGKMPIDKATIIVTGANWFVNECMMSQARFWKVARSQSEIQANMYYAVNANNPNLIAYWPMDEGEGTGDGAVLHDISGNGHDATSAGNIIQHWEHNVRFDGK